MPAEQIAVSCRILVAYHRLKKWNKVWSHAAMLATGETHCYICYRPEGR